MPAHVFLSFSFLLILDVFGVVWFLSWAMDALNLRTSLEHATNSVRINVVFAGILLWLVLRELEVMLPGLAAMQMFAGVGAITVLWATATYVKAMLWFRRCA